MILSVDPGYAACGWAIVRPKLGIVRACGVIETARNKAVDVPTDRARRVGAVARTLLHLAREHDCKVIAAEQMQGYGAASAVAANMLPWGVLIGIAAALGIELYEVSPKQWQHAVLPGCTGKINYAELAGVLKKFTTGQAGSGLLDIETKLRTHALDAVGIGLYAALASATRILAASDITERKDAA